MVSTIERFHYSLTRASLWLGCRHTTCMPPHWRLLCTHIRNVRAHTPPAPYNSACTCTVRRATLFHVPHRILGQLLHFILQGKVQAHNSSKGDTVGELQWIHPLRQIKAPSFWNSTCPHFVICSCLLNINVLNDNLLTILKLKAGPQSTLWWGHSEGPCRVSSILTHNRVGAPKD